MATVPFEALRLSILERDLELLEKELAVIKHDAQFYKKHLSFSHDGDVLIVFGDLKYKAYVPKKFNSWTVKFIEWDGETDITPQIDLDLQIHF